MKRTFSVLLLVSLSCFANADQPPNFVLFIADDISSEDLGCYGHPSIKTPNIDNLAAQGMRFDNAYLTISSCSPSRCSIISGRYPHNHGAPELNIDLPPDQPKFPKVLRVAGYYTLLSGKHHMGNSVNRGFDLVSGGLRCSRCPRGSESRKLGPVAREQLSALIGGAELPAVRKPRAHLTLLDDFVTYHMLAGRRLQSFQFLHGYGHDGE